MFDRALRITFAEFSTLFLVVALVVVPLHLGHGFAFRNVIEVSELHGQIADFPADRTVRDVGPDRLSTYRMTYLLLNMLEIVLLVLLVRPVRKIVEDHIAGRVTTVPGAWSGLTGAGGGHLRGLGAIVPLLGAATVALILGLLVERVGLLVAQPLGDARAWVGLGLAQGLARAVAAPFFLVTWAWAAHVKAFGQGDPIASRSLKGGQREGDGR